MKKKYIWVLVVTLMVILVASVGIKGILTNSQADFEQLLKTKVQNVDLTKIPDGAYMGSYQVFPINVKVEVTVNQHKITAIELLKHFNGQGRPAEIIPDKVIEAQSLEVNTVAGATYSSKVILKAIESALNSTGK